MWIEQQLGELIWGILKIGLEIFGIVFIFYWSVEGAIKLLDSHWFSLLNKPVKKFWKK